MTLKKYLKEMKKLAKKRGILEEEMVPLYSGGDTFLLRTRNDDNVNSFWRFGYEQDGDTIKPVIKC